MAFLVFQFRVDISANEAISAVADHFGVSVSVNGAVASVPAHIKQAVEAVGAVEVNPAVAFGGLLNGAGNAAPSSAVVALSPIAPVVSPDTSATLPPVSSAPALQPANGAVAPVVSAAPTSHAGDEFDSTGLPWDERIHSGAKSKTEKGEWRSRKGTDKGLIKSIEAELRAKFPNGAGGTATSPANGVPNAPAGAPVAIDPAAKRAAALEYAHAEGLRVAGPQMIDDNMLAHLNAGKAATLSGEQSDWYAVYVAKRNASFTEYMQRETTVTPGNVAYGTPDASASQTQTGSATDAKPAVPSLPASSQTAAVTAPVATIAPQGELDGTGLPHDARIHVGAKIKDSAGVWVQRHDVSPQDKLNIIAELRAALAGNVAAQVSNTPVAPVGTPVAVPPPIVSADDARTAFPKLMQWIVANQVAGRIAPTAGPTAAQQLGFVDPNTGNGSLALMMQQNAYWTYVVDMLIGQGAV